MFFWWKKGTNFTHLEDPGGKESIFTLPYRNEQRMVQLSYFSEELTSNWYQTKMRILSLPPGFLVPDTFCYRNFFAFRFFFASCFHVSGLGRGIKNQWWQWRRTDLGNYWRGAFWGTVPIFPVGFLDAGYLPTSQIWAEFYLKVPKKDGFEVEKFLKLPAFGGTSYMFKAVLGTFLLEDNKLIFCLTDFFTMKIRLNFSQTSRCVYSKMTASCSRNP